MKRMNKKPTAPAKRPVKNPLAPFLPGAPVPKGVPKAPPNYKPKWTP